MARQRRGGVDLAGHRPGRERWIHFFAGGAVYIPTQFAEIRVSELHACIRANPFAPLVIAGPAGIEATHLPFILDTECGEFGTLRAHLAKANPQAEALAAGSEALVVFSGPHAYISPRWYRPGNAVPTWNYLAVHAYGIPRVVSEAAEVRELLRAQVATFEAGAPEPWTMENAPAAYADGLLSGIVAFEIPIARLEGKAKMSQNRPEDLDGIFAGLRRNTDPMSAAVAMEVEARRAR